MVGIILGVAVAIVEVGSEMGVAVRFVKGLSGGIGMGGAAVVIDVGESEGVGGGVMACD